MNRRWLRWMPAAVIPAVVATAVAVGSLPAGAADPLPGKTPDQILALIAEHNVQSLSGKVEQTSNVGLPELPNTGPSPAAAEMSWLELLSGPHTARVYADGPTKARIQVLDRMAERDVVWNGSELWLYSSRNNSAAHLTLPDERSITGEAPGGQPEHPDYSAVRTPAQLAQKLLTKLDPGTDVAVGPEVQVAGRAAYNLVLTPRSQQSLVGSVSIGVDGETGLPLSFSVLARGQTEPAFSVAYTSVSLGAPESSLFEFTPPPGATVKELQPPQRPVPSPDSGKVGPSAEGEHPTLTGSGWETVVELPASKGSSVGAALLSEPLLQQATVAVAGGKVLTTSLVNILLTNDGRIFAGAVPVEMLQAAATPR